MVILVAGLVLAGCGSGLVSDYFDPAAELTRDDFKQGMAAREPAARPPPPPIPELQPVIAVPALGPEISSRRVTVTVTETTPLKDVLIELAREARIDFELDPRIEGGVIFSAYDRPFDEVLRRLSDLARLRYSMKNGVLRIELDEPYHVNYRVNYLSLVRTTTSEIGAAGTVVAAGATGGSASSSRVSSISVADFWTELEANLTQIIVNQGRLSGLVAPPAPAPAAAPEGAPEGAPEAALEAAEGEEPILTAAAAREQAGTFFTVNRQAGIVSVFGTQREHRAVAAYLQKLRAAVSAQVLIEAKVFEVRLSEEFRFGINFSTLFDGRTNVTGAFAFEAIPTSALDVFTLTAGGADLSVLANAIEEFGTVRTLSSPRLTVMHNQTAVLKVAEERVFFDVKFEQTTTTGDNPVTTSTANATPNTVLIGLVLTVQPSINLDSDEITLTLRPTITSVVGTRSDPAVEIEGLKAAATPNIDPGVAAAFRDIQSLIPEIAVQEIDSVVTLRSGQVLVMGGLMQDRVEIEETGVPVLSDIPWLGRLFKAREETTTKTELVIFLRATIVRNDSIDPYDIELYQRFGEDRRPLVF